MMTGHQDAYIAEKMVEFDARRAAQRHALFVERPPRARARRPLAPIVRATGRGMRRFGEAMEHWASPSMHMCETKRSR